MREKAPNQAVGASPPKSYVLLEDYLSRNNGQTKTFKKGETVVGIVMAPPPNAKVDPRFIMVNVNGFLIPMGVLKVVPPVEIKDENKIVGQTKKIVKTSNFKQGAVIGIVLGAGYGFFNNKSVFYSAMIGMLAGGAVGHLMFSKKTNK